MKTDKKLTVEAVAGMCHDLNKDYCEWLDDYSQPSWTDAPQWQKDSAINGVNFLLLNPMAGPESSHSNWLVEKINAGWVYGEEKNEALKTHPCLVNFINLPPEQQAKDKLFKGVVDAVRDLVAPS